MGKLIVPTTAYTPEHVKSVRQKTGLSQNLFALALGVTPTTVRNWERGRIEPSGAVTRVLDLVEEDSSILSVYISK